MVFETMVRNSSKKPRMLLLFRNAMPRPSINDSTSAVITPISGGMSTVK